MADGPSKLPPHSPPSNPTIELTDRVDPSKPNVPAQAPAKPMGPDTKMGILTGNRRDPDEDHDQTIGYQDSSGARMALQMEETIGRHKKRQERAKEILFLKNWPRLRIAVLFTLPFLGTATGVWVGNRLSQQEEPTSPPAAAAPATSPPEPKAVPITVEKSAEPSPEPVSDEFDQLREKSYDLMVKKSYAEALKVLIELHNLNPDDIEVTEDLIAAYWKLMKAAKADGNEEETAKLKRKANRLIGQLPKDLKKGAIKRHNQRVRGRKN